MGVRFFDNVAITGLSASGTTDANGTWNTSVDLGSFVTIPDGATGVILRVVNSDSSQRWAGVRTPGKTAIEWQIDTFANGVYDVICQTGAGNTIDLYCENATFVTFRVVGVTDPDWVFHDIDGSRPSVTSTASNWQSRTFSGAEDGALAVLTSTTVQGWRPTGASTNTTYAMSGFKLMKLNETKSLQLNVGTSVTAIASIVGGVTFSDWLTERQAVTFDSTWRDASMSASGSAGVMVHADKSGTGHRWDFRENGSAYTTNHTGTSPYTSFFTKVSEAGAFEYSAETGGNGTLYLFAKFADFTEPGPATAIDSLVGGSTTSQYQLKTANVSGFTETLLTGTLGASTLLDVVDNEDGTVTFRPAGDLASGTYTLTLTATTESATLDDVVHTQTHELTAPSFPVNTLSIFNQQGWAEADEDVYWTGQVLPAELSFIAPATDWSDVDASLPVSDYLQAQEGYTGEVVLTFNRIYRNGDTSGWSVTIEVVDGVIVGVYQTIAQTRSQTRTQTRKQTEWF